MRHGERIHHIHASGDPPADRHFADAEKFGAFAEVNGGVFEVHTKSIVSTGGLGIGSIAGNGARRNACLFCNFFSRLLMATFATNNLVRFSSYAFGVGD